MKLAKTAVLAALVATGASAQTNLGAQKPEARLPFVMTKVATFNLPWRLAFLPDGRMLITEKVGPVWLVTQTGEKTPVANARTTSSISPMLSPATVAPAWRWRGRNSPSAKALRAWTTSR
jgi:glucose/arabinose dehydrogenase